jgi:hypothetical protein
MLLTQEGMTPGPLPQEEAGHQLQLDEAALDNMINLLHQDVKIRGRAIEALAAMKDIGVVPALVEALFFQRNLPGWEKAMHELTGQRIGKDWPAWMEWLGRQTIEPHRVYPIFKAKIFGKIDPAFQAFLSPTAARTIRLDEVVWGGVKKDGIPSLDNPAMIPAVAARYLDEQDVIFGVSINGVHHAYPLRIMNWHEMLNAVIGGAPASLSYCTLCGAAVLYETTVNGVTYDFGSSGLLYRSNKLMYDRQTNSLWSSLHGEPVIGSLAGQGLKLKRLYVVRTTWGEWRRLHPTTMVLDKKTGFNRNYAEGAAYADYFASDETMFPVAWRDKRLKAKEWIYGIIIDGISKAFPLRALRSGPIAHDRVANKEIVLICDSTRLSVRAYESKGHRFVAKKENGNLVDEAEDEWLIEEEKLTRLADNEELERLPGHLAYWFGWYAFFPKTAVYEGK